MNFRKPLQHLFLCGALTLPMAACSSQKNKDNETGAATSRLNGGIQNKGRNPKTGEYDHSIVSQFDKKSYSASSKVKEGKFWTGRFAGKHDYTGSGAYKATEFSQSGKKSREGGEAFSESGQEPRETGQEFGTSNSRYGNKQARQGGQEFGASDNAFKTRAVSDAAKSQKKNERPEIIPKDESEGDKSAYTEAEVSRLVNRN